MARTMVERMIGAAMLNVDVYEEVEADENATGQAAAVVGLVAAASAISSLEAGIPLIVFAAIMAFVGWGLWAGVTYIVGEKIFDGTATWGELLRTLGFAQTPQLFVVLGLIPGLVFIVTPVVGIWSLVTGIVAIRQALDFTTGKAVLTAIISLVVVFTVTFGLSLVMALLFVGVATVAG